MPTELGFFFTHHLETCSRTYIPIVLSEANPQIISQIFIHSFFIPSFPSFRMPARSFRGRNLESMRHRVAIRSDHAFLSFWLSNGYLIRFSLNFVPFDIPYGFRQGSE